MPASVFYYVTAGLFSILMAWKMFVDRRTRPVDIYDELVGALREEMVSLRSEVRRLREDGSRLRAHIAELEGHVFELRRLIVTLGGVPPELPDSVTS